MKDDEEAFLSIERVIAHAPQKNDRLAVKCRSDRGQILVLEFGPEQALEILISISEFLEHRATQYPREGACKSASNIDPLSCVE